LNVGLEAELAKRRMPSLGDARDGRELTAVVGIAPVTAA
jgi:hypothetical protein